MARYRVRFIKHIYDSTGHPHDSVEGTVEVRQAKSQDRAVTAAQRRFERQKGIPSWSLYADRFEVDAGQEP